MVAQHLSKHRFTRSDPIHFYPDEGGVVYRGLARKFRNHPIENENGDLIRVQGRSTVGKSVLEDDDGEAEGGLRRDRR